MLEVFVKIACSGLMSITGFYVIKKITNSNVKFFTTISIALIIISALFTTFLYRIEYNGITAFIIFITNIIIYKFIFKLKIEESTIATSLMMLILSASDLITTMIFREFCSVETIRGNILVIIMTNISVSCIEILIVNLKNLNSHLKKFYSYCNKNKPIVNIIFFILLFIGFCITAYSIIASENWNYEYLINTGLMVVLIMMAFIFVKNRNNYNELTDKYDSMFSYVQNFEDWIEKEQLNRHEYKNQLAVLRCLTKEKKVKEKIDEILEDNINIGGEVINQLKQLPKGGIKGLMYYKVAIAQKQKINVTADVSLETKSILNSLTEKDLRTICKLLGIYLDNAIEASAETRKKVLLIEVYELSNKVCFVISNTFKKSPNFEDRNRKGVTTKGEGHGNGLYFASKLITANDYLESKQDVVDGYYIQQLIINRKGQKNKSTKN